MEGGMDGGWREGEWMDGWREGDGGVKDGERKKEERKSSEKGRVASAAVGSGDRCSGGEEGKRRRAERRGVSLACRGERREKQHKPFCLRCPYPTLLRSCAPTTWRAELELIISAQVCWTPATACKHSVASRSSRSCCEQRRSVLRANKQHEPTMSATAVKPSAGALCRAKKRDAVG